MASPSIYCPGLILQLILCVQVCVVKWLLLIFWFKFLETLLEQMETKFRHEGLKHRRCIEVVFWPQAPLRVFFSGSGPEWRKFVLFVLIKPYNKIKLKKSYQQSLDTHHLSMVHYQRCKKQSYPLSPCRITFVITRYWFTSIIMIGNVLRG